MLRIHLTVADAMKVRMVVLGPLAELEFSLDRLLHTGPPLAFEGWRSRTMAAGPAVTGDVRELARFLARPGDGVVDLFTVAGATEGYAEGIDRLRQAPAEQLRHEFAAAHAEPRSAWLRDLADGDRRARHRLAAALDSYHAVAIEPYWPRIRALLDRERARLTDVLVNHGLDAMLAGLAPMMRWQSPVLEVPDYLVRHPGGAPVEVHLRGRGLLLAPSLYCAADPGLFTPWDDGPAVLIYPIGLNATDALGLWRGAGEPGDRALAGLLGATRAAALRVIADGCTTTGLARRLGISPGGASQHATVLREAGLVASHRHRNTVRHTLTGLGADLLNAG